MTTADRLHFDRVADAYEGGRPPYPTELYDALAARGVLRPGARLLEIGAGSGQATAELVARGAVVDAVEPGPELAARLRARLPGVSVLEIDLEDADLGTGAYDAVVAATSLHWVDLDRVLPRLHAALRPGGLLAPWWTVFGDRDVPTPFRDRVQEIVGERDPAVERPLRLDERRAELGAGGLFTTEEPLVLRWSVTLSNAQLHALFTSFPTWTPDRVDRVAAAADDLGGSVVEHYRSVLYVARRVDG